MTAFLWFLLGSLCGSLAMALAYSVQPDEADYWDVSPDPEGGQTMAAPTLVVEVKALPWEGVAA